MPQKTTDVSIVICTYNRADRLSILFESLKNLATSKKFTAEFIFVDNNSTDDTRSKIILFSQESNLSVKYFFAKKKGSSAAKNAGIKNSIGNLVVILDDDCLPEKNWLNNIFEYFSVTKVDLAGGKVLLYDPRDLPISIRIRDDDFLLESPSQLFGGIPGCNMAIRRSVLENIGLFDERIGAGLPLAGEDVDLIYRALQRGYTLRYTPNFIVYHNHGRRTAIEAEKLNKSYILGRGGIYAKHIFAKDSQIIKLAYWEIRSIIARIVNRTNTTENKKSEIKNLFYLLQGFFIYSYRFISKK